MQSTQKLWGFKEEELPLATTSHEGDEGPGVKRKWQPLELMNKHNFINRSNLFFIASILVHALMVWRVRHSYQLAIYHCLSLFLLDSLEIFSILLTLTFLCLIWTLTKDDLLLTLLFYRLSQVLTQDNPSHFPGLSNPIGVIFPQ